MGVRMREYRADAFAVKKFNVGEELKRYLFSFGWRSMFSSSMLYELLYNSHPSTLNRAAAIDSLEQT